MFEAAAGTTRSYLAFVDLTDPVSSKTEMHAQTGPVRVIAEGSGVLYVGGDSHDSGSFELGHLAAVDEASGNSMPWIGDTDGVVRALATSTDTVYVGGDFTMIGGTKHGYLALVC